MYTLTCKTCGRKSDFFCRREEVSEMNCGYCNAEKSMEYHFKDNMTTAMVRSPVSSLSGREKLERIQKDMRETFKIKDFGPKSETKREDNDGPIDWDACGREK